MTSYFPILAGTFDAMTERCQFAENERPFHRRLHRSLETSEREKRAPGRGYFATKALGPQLMDVVSRRIPVGTAAHSSFCHLPEKMVRLQGKTFLPCLALT